MYCLFFLAQNQFVFLTRKNTVSIFIFLQSGNCLRNLFILFKDSNNNHIRIFYKCYLLNGIRLGFDLADPFIYFAGATINYSRLCA